MPPKAASPQRRDPGADDKAHARRARGQAAAGGPSAASKSFASTITPLLEQLEDDSQEVREQALTAIVSLPREALVEHAVRKAAEREPSINLT